MPPGRRWKKDRLLQLCGRRSEIWIVNIDGSGIKQLTKNKGNDTNPAFSPDGSYILLLESDQDGTAWPAGHAADGSDIKTLRKVRHWRHAGSLPACGQVGGKRAYSEDPRSAGPWPATSCALSPCRLAALLVGLASLSACGGQKTPRVILVTATPTPGAAGADRDPATPNTGTTGADRDRHASPMPPVIVTATPEACRRNRDRVSAGSGIVVLPLVWQSKPPAIGMNGNRMAISQASVEIPGPPVD